MTTSAQAIRHPWFDPPTMKRRLPANDDGDDESPHPFDASPSAFSTRRRKRVRYNSLENRLAHMTLATTTPEEVGMWPKTSPHVQDILNVVLPSSVEEPGTEPVDMEVEPTLVAIDDWESTESGRLDIKEVQISPAVLECLRRQTKCPPPLVPLPGQTSQALVLYRPAAKLSEPTCDHQEAKPTLEDVVMEVE